MEYIYCSGTCLYGRIVMLMAFERNIFIAPPHSSSLWSGHSATISIHSLSLHFYVFPLKFTLWLALAISIPPPQSATASAVPAPGGTSYKTGVQEKTSQSAARYSLALIRLPALLMLTQISAHPHLMHGLVLLAFVVWARSHLRVRPFL